MKVIYTEYPVEVPLFNLFREIWIRNSPAWRWQRELIKIHTSEKPYLNTIRESRLKSTAKGNVFHCAAYFVYCSQYILIDVFFSWCGNKYAFILFYLFINWFGRFVPSTGILTWTPLWNYLVSTLMVQWQNTCLWCKGARVQIHDVLFITFSGWHPWEPRFKDGFHNSFWDYVVPDRIPWMTLELCKWIWERVLANSFSGIHKYKIICSAHGKCNAAAEKKTNIFKLRYLPSVDLE